MTDLTHFQYYGQWSPPSARLHFVPRETMRGIIERVAKAWGVTYADMIGPDLHRRVSKPRQQAMYEMRATGLWSFAQIGKALGGRDHATVLHGVRAHERRAAVEAVAGQAEIAA